MKTFSVGAETVSLGREFHSRTALGAKECLKTSLVVGLMRGWNLFGW